MRGGPCGLPFLWLLYNENMVIGWIILGVVFVFALTAFTGAPFVPSFNTDLREIFVKLYPLSERDFLVDLGSGDGKVLKVANSFGARALGVEINPFLYVFSKIRFIGNRDVKVRFGDLFHMKYPEETTVFYAFGDSRDIERIAKVVQKQANRSGHAVYMISHAFDLASKKPAKKHGAYLLYKFEEEK